MKPFRFSRSSMLVALLLLAASSAQAANKYRVITEGDLGFKRGNTFFSLKMTAADFEARFGAPEKRSRLANGARLAYLSEGIAVATDGAGIRSITFIITPAKTERFQDYQPCSATTSGGISRSSSLADVLKSEGQPTDRSEDPVLGAITLRYKRGGSEYSFRFKDGVLSQVVVTGSN